MGVPLTSSDPRRSQTVRAYHERTKHHYRRMARSSGFMDWANQPDPFRRYAGAALVSLPLASRDPDFGYDGLYTSAAPAAAPFSRTTIAAFLELSLGLSAWKALGRDRWALRINPSSGNLHPTEAYLLLVQVEGLADGLYHYEPENHALERRIHLPPAAREHLPAAFGPPIFLVALSSVIWREAWKYGERAFRYCQHDIGHALAALRFSAHLQGWQLNALTGIGEEKLARLLGFDRTAWRPLEEETPAVLVLVRPSTARRPPKPLPETFMQAVAAQPIEGRPNSLSPECRRWKVLHEVAAATRQEAIEEPPAGLPSPEPGPASSPDQRAATVIRRRRSAVAFDYRGRMDLDSFLGLIGRTRPWAACPPFDMGLGRPRISLLVFVHQVAELAPGLYLFMRHRSHREALQADLDPTFLWQPAASGTPLFLLREGDFRATAADLACRQEIAGASVFSLAMLAEFQTLIDDAPWRYRRLYWEAGLIGQVLYLEAEARGYRGTGIGCYYDDPVHELLGIRDQRWQDLYHFTVGLPLEDPRLQTFPPYAHRGQNGKRGRR
jgi:SagB-type dehydrogenase family enzyme